MSVVLLPFVQVSFGILLVVYLLDRFHAFPYINDQENNHNHFYIMRRVSFKDAQRINPRMINEAYDQTKPWPQTNKSPEEIFKQKYKDSTLEQKQHIDAIFVKYGFQVAFTNNRFTILDSNIAEVVVPRVLRLSWQIQKIEN